jgi:hypothetical protein
MSVGPTCLLKLSAGQRGRLIPSELLRIDDDDAAAFFTSQWDVCMLLHVSGFTLCGGVEMQCPS